MESPQERGFNGAMETELFRGHSERRTEKEEERKKKQRCLGGQPGEVPWGFTGGSGPNKTPCWAGNLEPQTMSIQEQASPIASLLWASDLGNAKELSRSLRGKPKRFTESEWQRGRSQLWDQEQCTEQQETVGNNPWKTKASDTESWVTAMVATRG